MIILDTDFLVNAIKNKVDVTRQIKAEYITEEIAVVDKTLDELKKINNSDSKTALRLIEVKKFKIIKTDRKKIADDLILDIVGTNDMVATQDKYFKRRLKYKGVKVLTIKHKDYVSI